MLIHVKEDLTNVKEDLTNVKEDLTAQEMNMREAVDNSRNRRIWRSLLEASLSANSWRRRNWLKLMLIHTSFQQQL